MNVKPSVKSFPDNSKVWSNSFNSFTATVYIPSTNLPESVVNFGYEAPYTLVFPEAPVSLEEAKDFADKSGLSKIASDKASSVTFVYPTCKDGWAGATDELFIELIKNSKIHQYHEDGMAILVNRFTHSTDGFAIRGAIFRTDIYAFGKSADYVARNLLKTINGEGLWGPADVTPNTVILSGLSEAPIIERNDIPVVSINNSEEINSIIKEKCQHSLITDSSDYIEIFNSFVGKYIRWVGNLEECPNLPSIGMKEEYCVTTLKTSPDNEGDYKGSAEHPLGYIAFYNKDVFNNGPVPLVLAFHGGGDSALHIAFVSEWYMVAHDHDFLLICVEDHLNSTATEMMEFIEILKNKYPIDSSKIYASGFSMGGCKSWDLYQEYPDVFAGLAPMDATFEVGLNVFGKLAPKEINKDVKVPIFYIGGEITPLPELPFQAEKCRDRMEYVFKVNDLSTPYNVKFEEVESWKNPIWGIDGDEIEKIPDESRGSILTINYFKGRDGRTYTAFASVSGQGHECRYHTCEHAYRFLSRFRRTESGFVEE